MQIAPETEMMHELTPEELKALQACFLEIIKDIDRVCQEHGLCYMAAGGTALGSVRHKGFIPWDDDVDILMPREDLNRFVELFEECMGDKYELTTPNSDKYQLESMISAVYKKNTLKAAFLDYNTPFPKGVHIDIFAIESVPRNPIVRGIKGVTAMGLQYIAVSTLFYHYRSPEKKKFSASPSPESSTMACGAQWASCSPSAPIRSGATCLTASCDARRTRDCGPSPRISATISDILCPKRYIIPPSRGRLRTFPSTCPMTRTPI